MSTSRTRPRRRSRGYTAVEVLSALTLLAIGASGVIGMQRVTLQGSEDARRFDMGNNIANGWLSRLQRDAAQWDQPNATFPNNNNLGATKWLSQIGPCGNNWCNPPAPASLDPSGMSGAFDIFGRDLSIPSTTATYCAQYRLQWIAPIGAGPTYNPAALMRAEVRVFWSRLERNPVGDCTTATPDDPKAYQLYHFVYATTMVREVAFRQ